MTNPNDVRTEIIRAPHVEPEPAASSPGGVARVLASTFDQLETDNAALRQRVDEQLSRLKLFELECDDLRRRIAVTIEERNAMEVRARDEIAIMRGERDEAIAGRVAYETLFGEAARWFTEYASELPSTVKTSIERRRNGKAKPAPLAATAEEAAERADNGRNTGGKV